MTFPQIRRLVDSLMLKYADEVEARRLRPVAQRFCDDLTRAVTGKKPGRRAPSANGPRSSSGGPRNAASNSRASTTSTITWTVASTFASCPRPTSSCAPCSPGPPPRHHPPRPRSPHPLLRNDEAELRNSYPDSDYPAKNRVSSPVVRFR